MGKKMLTLLAAAWLGFAFAGPAAATASPDLDFSKANPKFVSAGGKTLLTLGGLTSECTSASSQGQWTTEGGQTGSTGSVQVVFKGCHLFNGFACTSPGSAAGEIKSEELVFHLVYIKGFFSPTIGILFTNNATTGRFAVTSCGDLTGTG